eukprot:UN03098
MPAANQIELHPLCQRPELIKYMKEENIFPIAYASLAPMSGWRKGSKYAGTKDEKRRT